MGRMPKRATDIPLARVDPARAASMVAPPSVEIRTLVPNAIRLSADGQYIEYAPGAGQRPSAPLHDCLSRFAKLAAAAPPVILQFAREWGPLGVCNAHKKRWGKHEDQFCGPDYVGPPPDPPDWIWVREAIEGWRQHAQVARDALLTADELLAPNAPGWDAAQQERAWKTATRVNVWLEDAGVRPTLFWAPRPGAGVPVTRATPALYLVQWDAPPDPYQQDAAQDLPAEYQYVNLFAVLGLQLATALATEGATQRCGWCGDPFVVGRDPTAGPGRPRRYCSDACTHEARKRVQRESVRRHRAKRATIG